MLHKCFFPLFLLVVFSANGQFKNDNVLYKTVDPADLCASLQKNNGYLLLDVRSAAEHYDTSSSSSYNLGHLKGAKNIDVRELGRRLTEIDGYKNKPVFVYCSHSQRSRRASKMLADSGYTNIFNINGGMTAIYYNSLKKKDCLKSLVETTVSYDIISADELCYKMGKSKQPFILDVRSDSAFRHISLNAKENAYGYFSGTVNIPLQELEKRMVEIPKGQDIIITDIDGDEAALAAVTLKRSGFEKVAMLIEGIDRLLFTNPENFWCKENLYQSPVRYKMLTATEFGNYVKNNTGYMLLDIRTTDEFANKYKDNWRNAGHIKNAINIPADDLKISIAGLGTDKTKEILIYSFGNGPELFAVAGGLQEEGFTNIKVLIGGIFNLRWTAGNVKGQSYLKDLVTDIPEANQ